MLDDIIIDKYRSMKKQDTDGPFNIRKVRDLVITELTDEFWMVIACDSTGGIGPKPNDAYYSTAYEVGRMAVRVPIMEILASGAVPVITADSLSVEMDPTGKEIIRGVKDESAEAGINSDKAITGSTEDNVETTQTGIGTVIIGLVHKSDFRPGSSVDGDAVVCVGLPKSAPVDKVESSDIEIANPSTVKKLNSLEFIHDILPVGSKGIKHEFPEIAKSADLKVSYSSEIEIDVNKSGGPSTCCLVSLPEDKIELLKQSVEQPVFFIGKLLGKSK